jgi:ABC-type transport system involved in cytochrome bd biosynthesis fused ATPase/permease subunit
LFLIHVQKAEFRIDLHSGSKKRIRKQKALFNLIKFCFDSFKHLTHIERRRASWTVFSLIFLSLLDLVGIVLLGTVATLTFNIVTGDQSLTRLEVLLQDLVPITVDRISLLGLISAVGVVLLLLKTILQAFFTYRFGKYLAEIESRISAELFNLMIRSDLNIMQTNKFSDYQYALLVGSNRFTTGIVGSVVYFVSDFVTTLLMSLFAIYASPASALSAMAIFILAYFVFNGPINRKANLFGESARQTYLSTTENLLETLQGIRDIRIYDKENERIKNFQVQKLEQSMTNQKTLWLNGLIRYILEVAILIAGSLAAVILIVTTDVKHAITVVTILVVIGFRLIPNIQRLQNSLNSLRLSRAATADLFRFIETFKKIGKQDLLVEKKGELKSISIQDISYSHDDNEVLKGINLIIPSHSLVLLLGESGSGKSTLLDLVSGLTSPTSGKIEFQISNDGLESSIMRIPMSYITQDCALFGSNLSENITLQSKDSKLPVKDLSQIISKLGLEKLAKRSDDFSESDEIRSDKSNVSGGERQRISIARAMFFDRDLVLMDEPTSALDKDNLEKVLNFIRASKGVKTILISTHSEELLELADYVLELSNGNQVFYGSTEKFIEERKK